MSAQETATLANSMCRREFERRKDTWEYGSSVFGEVIDAALMHDRVVAQFALRRQLSEPGET